MKRPIKWHEECLANGENWLAQLELQHKAATRKLEKSRAALQQLKSQIARAKRLGKDGFDEERFQPEKGGE